MPRSVGITVSAVVAIIGSGLTLLLGVGTVLGSVFLSKSGAEANAPANFGFFIVIEAMVFFCFGGWGLAAAIGLLKLKQWARISMLVFAAILVFISLLAAVVLAFIPLPNPNHSNVPSNFMPMMRIGMVLFYATFVALGGFWIYFFNKQNVKAQFQEARPSPGAMQRVRPLSISIIGWFLLIGSASAPLVLLSDSAFLPGKQLPVFFMGFFLAGRGASVIYIFWCAAQMVGAVGLLKLRKWGLFATIGLQCLTVVNAALLVGIPANREKLQQIMETMMASLNARMHTAAVPVFPIWIGLASCLPMVSVILWFLVTRKHAFNSAPHELAHHRS